MPEFRSCEHSSITTPVCFSRTRRERSAICTYVGLNTLPYKAVNEVSSWHQRILHRQVWISTAVGQGLLRY